MIELPEATVLSNQINETIVGKRIKNVLIAKSPHKFAWLNKNLLDYSNMLVGKVIDVAQSVGGFVEISVEGVVLLFCDGVNLRYHDEKGERPLKHQLMLESVDSSAMSASVQMYGGLWCFNKCEVDNSYYLNAKIRISPISEEFNIEYFNEIYSSPGADKLSAKALLTTNQRIPGLGNGTLQDILYNAKIHPKKKIGSFTEKDKNLLYNSIKNTLKEIVTYGGRDTEKDLFGNFGGYITKLSKNTVNKQCTICGNTIIKETYLGGSVYYCPLCQKI